jgi:transcriptional regulator with XRE-family HTH domain
VAFHENFDTLISDSGLSDREIAERIGIHEDTLKRLRAGIASPRIETLQKIAMYFHKTTDELLT